ncbi:FtsH protease activity modulator HflK [Candidatus Haliotispira prima]|uniref:Protein HflK n=1 Tax=Candidatus Haliotispira prima TaxID=3034016 RepID=A0ABY8MJT3_9SPIO|nr:FtsH protease activity modulator HflK [Candidatus Haliotispira prima]
MSDILDELRRNLQKWQNSGKSSGSSGGKILPYVIVILVLVILVANSIYSIDEKEVGVVTRFGRFHGNRKAGLHFKVPIMDRLYRVPQTTQSLAFGYRTTNAGIQSQFSKEDYSHESTMLTGDLNIIQQSFAIQYIITGPKDWLFSVDSAPVLAANRRGLLDNRIKTIRDVCISVVNHYVGNNYAEDVQEKGRELIAEPARLEINKILRERVNLGVTLQNLNLNQVVYNDLVQKAIEDVNAAEQDRDRLINEGQEAYNKEIPKVRGQAEQTVLQAEGAVARFNALYTQYRENPEIFRQRYYYETMEKVLQDSGGKLTIVDKDLENFLPIKNLAPAIIGPQVQ